MFSGWTQLAFAEELCADVVPVDVAGRALVAVRRSGTYTVYDGRCPHRGAHLGFGGRLDGGVIVCPFHGHRVQLADDTEAASTRFRVRGHPTVQAAAGLFVLLDRRHDTGLGARLAEVERTHYVHPAFSRTIAVPPEYVIENVLDADHFAEVHALAGRPDLTVSDGAGGSLVVDGNLETHRPNLWQRAEAGSAGGGTRARFTAEVFSPTVVVTALRSGDDTNVVITAATPTADGGCVARVTVALPRAVGGGAPTVRHLSSLVSGSRTAFEQDSLIWEHLDPTVVPEYVEGDRLVRDFRDFCARFEDA